jgi:hypothetical protein
MSVTVDRIPATSKRDLPPPARILLTPPGAAAHGPLDGAWWPRSRDLPVELPALTDALDRTWGRITRITVNPRFWPAIPRKVPVNGHVVHVGWFATEQDTDDLLLLSYTVGRWDLLVIPPETDPRAAARLMSAAADPDNLLTASCLLANDGRTRPSAHTPGSREEEWESDGGALCPERSTQDSLLQATRRQPPDGDADRIRPWKGVPA